eukprot:3776682-Pleurochrysis_carterae.AAC.1
MNSCHCPRVWQRSSVKYLSLLWHQQSNNHQNHCLATSVEDAASHGEGAGAGAEGGRTYKATLGQGCSRAAAAMRKRELKSLRSEARALR